MEDEFDHVKHVVQRYFIIQQWRSPELQPRGMSCPYESKSCKPEWKNSVSAAHPIRQKEVDYRDYGCHPHGFDHFIRQNSIFEIQTARSLRTSPSTMTDDILNGREIRRGLMNGKRIHNETYSFLFLIDTGIQLWRPKGVSIPSDT